MDQYTATELAFKNGYEKGYEAAKAEIVHCKDCKHYDKDALWCNINSHAFGEPFYNWYEEDFCSYGEKELKPNITQQTADALNKMGEKAHGG